MGLLRWQVVAQRMWRERWWRLAWSCELRFDAEDVGHVLRLGLVEVAALELTALELATEEERAGEDATLTGALEEEVALTWLLVGDAF